MKPLLDRLRDNPPLVADGAMGTMLFDKGLEPGACPESINLTRPDVLTEIAEEYLDAGAALIQTNTFGGTPLKLAQHGLEARTREINLAAVEAVRKAVCGSAYVSGSCGPSGKMLKPLGDVDPDDLYESFHVQMQAFRSAGVDVICIETMTDLGEATIAIRAAKDVAPAIPVMATMTFDPGPRGFFTMMGVSIEQAAAGLGDAGADVVGSNCGNGVDQMIEITAAFRALSDLPILIQPNAGLPEMRDGRLVYAETPAYMAERIPQLIEAGATIIGGCCGTTPAHIRAIREAIDSMR
ncbi:MAG: homocysteine S-methyltransferase family protein [Phycisphaerales bacterium]|nr:homocysteine S-methyltransferase family protein [Phycisphaerales bacterium]